MAKKIFQEKLEEVERKIRVIYVASYIPRECGIATFTKDLTTAINILNPFCLAEITVVNEANSPREYPWEVKFKIEQDNLKTYLNAADYINQSSAQLVDIQHEFGIFGGDNGEYITSFMNALTKPIVITLHTVLPKPDQHHRMVVRKMASLSQALVVMANVARDRLVRTYGVDVHKVVVIPHGVPDITYGSTAPAKKQLKLEGKNIISTFGLINAGKGLEYAIIAMNKIVQKVPQALFLILGETHPVVARIEGERYRKKLENLVKKYKLEQHVFFENRYLTLDELILYLRATNVYLTPYLNAQQITSGTLAYAVGAGRTCVSTPYIYAKEVLSEGRGVLVNFRDSRSIAKACIELLLDHEKRKKIEKKAYLYGRNMTWPNVALKYLDLFHLVIEETKKKN
jgi:glycosyltransferase involved in cell wall biosynthesis